MIIVFLYFFDHVTAYFPLLIYLLAINIITFLVYGIDKYKAKHHRWRISEAALLLLAVVGGSIGAICGMKLLHHKTQHKKFKYLLTLILTLQILLCLTILYLLPVNW